ncbi:MBL fold metallo-hydrolase [Dysgonomonas sp. 511]|uniref:MBL fold metallo-hydrolase n=1 Tax=Dysgonomonas sp. 511 TaxID=2302930 RepID=UPI0013D31956|nr:MBL fold metallo-hydrolase [Dysgonomonas sp. 511]NDV78915.1 MBL fold metallo-hydrolase [Dysgonomonas sp. 511]
MQITIHRGTKQIGGNCIEISSDETRIIFDIGDELPEVNENKERERIIPDVQDLFLSSEKTEKPIDAVFISHMHGDHIGLIDKIKTNIPVYIGKYAFQIWNTIQEFTNRAQVDNPIRYLFNEKVISIKDIAITPFLIDHSAFDSYSFLIECNRERIFYTGDFRCHGFAKKYTVAIQNNPLLKNIETLLIEGTNLYKDNFIAESEFELSKKVEKVMVKENTVGNVFVLQSSANIARIQAIYNAAKATGRILLVDIFTANILCKLPKRIPNPFTFDDVYLFFPMALTKKAINDKPHLFKPFGKFKIASDELLNRKDMVILVRESMVYEVKKRIKTENSCLIYSKWEGYKEEYKTAEFLELFDTVVDVHTSGHADIPTIKNFVSALNPKTIIPIHTITPNKYVDLFGEKVKFQDKNSII